MTNLEWIKKKGIKELIKEVLFYNAINNGKFDSDLQAKTIACLWLIEERSEPNVQFSENHECNLRGSDIPFHESGSDEG